MEEDQPVEDPRELLPEQMIGLKYAGEDGRAYFLIDRSGTRLQLPKNRNLPDPSRFAASHPLDPAFQLLAAAFLGLAPAGLGTLLFAPLALLWTVFITFRRPLGRADWIRTALVWGMAAGLLSLAIPMSLRFLEHLS